MYFHSGRNYVRGNLQDSNSNTSIGKFGKGGKKHSTHATLCRITRKDAKPEGLSSFIIASAIIRASFGWRSLAKDYSQQPQKEQ